MKYLFFLISAILLSCTKERTITKKRIGKYIVESKFINDTIPDGITKYFNQNGELVSSYVFSNGQENGVGINYYSNGNIHNYTNYINGKKNGYHYVYNDIGELIFKNFYFFGQSIGDEIYFQNGKVSGFTFINFERKKLFWCSYDSIGITGAGGSILNIGSQNVFIDNKIQRTIFVYLIKPPKVSVKYSYGAINDETNEKKDIALIKSSSLFWDTTLSAPSSGWKYYVSAHYFDSINNFDRIHYSIIQD